MDITDARLAKLRALIDSEPGLPWRLTDSVTEPAIRTASGWEVAYAGDGQTRLGLIVAAVNALPGLLAEVDQLRAELAGYRGDTRHIIDLRPLSFTIQHPLACRPNLFDCPYNGAARQVDVDNNAGLTGRFYCELQPEGWLAILDRVPDPDQLAADLALLSDPATGAAIDTAVGISLEAQASVALDHDPRSETFAVDGPERPRMVVLCGSTRFPELWRQATAEETLAGRIVLSIGFNLRTDHDLFDGKTPDELARIKLDADLLHKRKIDRADEVLIVSDESGYIGDSTRSEMAHAEQQGKPIRWWQPVAGNPSPLSVACPVCGAPPRRWCTAAYEGDPVYAVHAARRTDASDEAAKQEDPQVTAGRTADDPARRRADA